MCTGYASPLVYKEQLEKGKTGFLGLKDQKGVPSKLKKTDDEAAVKANLRLIGDKIERGKELIDIRKYLRGRESTDQRSRRDLPE